MDVYNHVASEIHGLVREDYPDYDPAVLREAIINGIVHRDYSSTGSMHVDIFPDRIEINSQGGIPNHL